MASQVVELNARDLAELFNSPELELRDGQITRPARASEQPSRPERQGRPSNVDLGLGRLGGLLSDIRRWD